MFFKKKNCRSARFCLFLLHFLQTAVCKPETGIGLLVMLFRMPAGMCAIFTRDRLDHRRGCAPSPAAMKYVLSCFVFGVCKRLCFGELQEQDSVSANSWRCILVLLLNYLSNINYANWLMGLILCCFFLMFP